MPNHLTTDSRLAQARGAHPRLRAAICALADRCQHVQVDQVALPLWEVRDEAWRTAREARALPRKERGFTFIELLVVMILVAILASMAYPAFSSVMERARKTQAKNDLTQIVTAVNAYYTEYGKYPTVSSGADVTFTGTTPGTSSGSSNAALIDVLRNNPTGPNSTTVTSLNPRGIVFIQPPTSSVSNPAKSGIDSAGVWYDPWGSPYNVKIDCDYDNQLATNPYSDAPGGQPVYIGVITWAFGKNGALGGGAPATGFNSEPGTAGNFSGSGDVISWQ
jgi:prepilin-type N-terminal cleavage/methylation domain-containing protein